MSYEMREIQEFFNDLKRVDKLPLAERKENARRFTEDLHRDPALIAERVGWLLNGSYGRGAYIKAMQVAKSPRMNQSAYLVQTTAALEWQVPPKMTIAAWRTLTAAQRTNLDRLVKKEIKEALSEAYLLHPARRDPGSPTRRGRGSTRRDASPKLVKDFDRRNLLATKSFDDHVFVVVYNQGGSKVYPWKLYVNRGRLGLEPISSGKGSSLRESENLARELYQAISR